MPTALVIISLLNISYMKFVGDNNIHALIDFQLLFVSSILKLLLLFSVPSSFIWVCLVVQLKKAFNIDSKRILKNIAVLQHSLGYDKFICTSTYCSDFNSNSIFECSFDVITDLRIFNFKFN